VKVLESNSDEVLALPLATAILEAPAVTTTAALAERVRACYTRCHTKNNQPAPTKDELNKAVARTMQAIRIEVNGEFDALDRLLDALPALLADGGVAAFLTFHSGEDRRVKKAFKQGFNDGVYSSWSRDVVRAGPEERRSNPRSKCAKLRFAVRSASAPPS
jgi:16S rRNA (cytosine1402-N4)-methyltransferase